MKVLRTFPDLQDEANVAEALVHGWSAFEGAPEAVWASMGEDRKEVEEATGSALEVGRNFSPSQSLQYSPEDQG